MIYNPAVLYLGLLFFSLVLLDASSSRRFREFHLPTFASDSLIRANGKTHFKFISGMYIFL